MDIRKLTKTVTFATLGVAISASSAFAFTAKSTTALNIRSGPGTGYDVVDALYTGEKVAVKKCTNSGKWCYVDHSGPDGWVAAKYLKKVGKKKPKTTYHSSSSSSEPSVTLGFNFGSGGSTFTFGFSSDGQIIQQPKHKKKKARVCFYKGKNFTGKKACVTPGDRDRLLSANWNDKISSIKVIGNAAVKVCKHKNFNGICRTIDRSVPKLGRKMNNEISSYVAYKY